ncbi:MAG: hypothetical protein U0Z26_19950 [Anaerolineales bacterium]
MSFALPPVHSQSKGETYEHKDCCFYSWHVYDTTLLGTVDGAISGKGLPHSRASLAPAGTSR